MKRRLLQFLGEDSQIRLHMKLILYNDLINNPFPNYLIYYRYINTTLTDKVSSGGDSGGPTTEASDSDVLRSDGQSVTEQTRTDITSLGFNSSTFTITDFSALKIIAIHND